MSGLPLVTTTVEIVETVTSNDAYDPEIAFGSSVPVEAALTAPTAREATEATTNAQTVDAVLHVDSGTRIERGWQVVDQATGFRYAVSTVFPRHAVGLSFIRCGLRRV